MTGTLTAQNISHKRCVAFVRTDRFCSTSCAGILVRPVLRSFRPKATPRAIYRYSDRVNNAARSKVYALGGVESSRHSAVRQMERQRKPRQPMLKCEGESISVDVWD